MDSISGISLVWSLGSHYILPIILSGAQLIVSSYLPSSNAAMLIDAAKVVIQIASASATTLRTTHLADLAASGARIVKAEDLARDILKGVPRPIPDDSIEETAPGKRTSMAASGPAMASLKDSTPKVSTP